VIFVDQISYRVLLRKEPEGGFTAIVPTLQGCISYGETIEEAIAMVKEAIEGYIESLKAHGEEIPTEKDVLEYTVLVKAHV
jgi:predicted RNase H-like HicB family nuclease